MLPTDVFIMHVLACRTVVPSCRIYCCVQRLFCQAIALEPPVYQQLQYKKIHVAKSGIYFNKWFWLVECTLRTYELILLNATETAIVTVLDDLLVALDDRRLVLLSLLDCSAASDLVSHQILLQHLE